jgi:DTW domain-containing protein YfiP
MVPIKEHGVPRMRLPIKVTVISHPKEKKSKSSIIPAKIIAPEDVEIIHTVEDIPTLLEEGDSYDSTVLLFPAEDAKDVSALSETELKAIKRVVLIDSTWSQTRHYIRHEQMRKLKMVKIQTEKTVFWRYQTGELDTSLATIEALYFFFRDYEVALNCKDRDYANYKGTFDNLLWMYAFNFQLI